MSLVLLLAPCLTAAPPQGEPWWLEPVTPPVPPEVQRADWVRNPIDAFVLARLEQAGQSPSPEASAEVLFRRSHLVLTGLVPTVSPTGMPHEQAVEELLEGVAHAEHMAQRWLDLARFAETHGFEMNQPRREAWRYRDWVVQAFLSDLSYGEFLGRQVAGDQVGDDAATGFLVAGPWDEVKSPDPVLTAEQRQAELADMVNAVSTGFLGLTVACARCHDHKFDPISQVDYFAMEALFAGVHHGERALRQPDDATVHAEVEAAHAAVLIELERAVAGVELGLLPGVVPASNEEQLNARRLDTLRFTVTKTSGGHEPCLDELEVFEGATNWAPRARVRSSGDYVGNPKHRLEHLTDGLYGNDHSWISNTPGAGWVELSWDRPILVDDVVWGRDREGVYADRLAIGYRIEGRLGEEPWELLASSKARLGPDADALGLRVDLLAKGPQREEALELLGMRDSLARELELLRTRPTAYLGVFREASPTHLLHRGDVTQPREVVDPAIPQALGDLELAGDSSEAERRVALATWLGDSGNPLVPRVLVNRLWAWHFGSGLVSTTSDFGVMGAEPSHPDLLDWLASELVRTGSLRHIHRLIATSATWRQSSAPRREALAVDADSRLLWRFPPRRIRGEVLRDSMLALTGELDQSLGGAGFAAFEPNENYVRNYVPLDRYGEEGHRRMLYMTHVRMEPEGTFGVFDLPDGGQVCPERGSSTTPLQALALFNSPFVLARAERLAERIQQHSGSSARAMVRAAFRMILGREPSSLDLEDGVRLLESDDLTALTRALLNCNEFLFLP